VKHILLASALLLTLGCSKDSDTATKANASKATSNLATRIVKRLEKAQPEIKFRIVDSSTIEYTLGDGSDATGKMSLDNLLLKCEQDKENCDANVEGFATAMLESFNVEEQVVSKDDLRAVLKDKLYLDATAEAMLKAPADMREENAIVTRPFGGDLSIVYVVDSANSMRLVSQGLLKELSINEAELHRIAIENMSKAFGGPLPTEQPVADSTLRTITLEDSYAAARLLLTPQWADVAAEFKGDVVAAVPARDMLMYCDGSAPEDVQAMTTLATKIAGEWAYPLSAQLFRFTGTSWEPLKP